MRGRDRVRRGHPHLSRRRLAQEYRHDDAQQHAGHRHPQDVLDAVILRHAASDNGCDPSSEDLTGTHNHADR